MDQAVKRTLRRTLDPRLKYHQCLYMYKYVNQKASTVILAIKMSVGVTQEVNLRNTLGKERFKQGIHPGLENRTDVTTSPRQGYQWPYKKDCHPPIFFKNLVILSNERCF